MLIFGFPIPVVVAFGMLVLVLLALGRVLASLRRAGRRRAAGWRECEPMEAFGPDEETMFRLARLEITPLNERARQYR